MKSEFPEHRAENGRIWEANARWWDDRIGNGNEFQDLLIEPATERLLEVSDGEVVLDIACGAGRFARRMARLGARVVAFDASTRFIERARERTGDELRIEYHVIDAADSDRLLALGSGIFDKAVSTMALMDMPLIEPMLAALGGMLKPGGRFVFSITHPCFNAPGVQRYAEMYEESSGQHVIRTGVKVSSYRTPFARKGEGILGQPEPQYYYHRSLQVLLQACFRAGFVVDGIEEPGFPIGKAEASVRWSHMPEICPVLVVRTRVAP